MPSEIRDEYIIAGSIIYMAFVAIKMTETHYLDGYSTSRGLNDFVGVSGKYNAVT